MLRYHAKDRLPGPGLFMFANADYLLGLAGDPGEHMKLVSLTAEDYKMLAAFHDWRLEDLIKILAEEAKERDKKESNDTDSPPHSHG